MKRTIFFVILIAVWVFCLGYILVIEISKAEARARAIYDRELTADEIARIYEDPFYEPTQFEERIHWDEDVDTLTYKMTCTMYGCDGTCSICDPSNPEWAKEPNEPVKPKNPRLNKKHPLSEGLIGFELFIPTWPDYIELEKDLVFDNRGEIRWYNDYRVIEKGTKIYFKD